MPHEKIPLLEYQSIKYDYCVKISHAFALHLSSVSKQCFLVGESRYQSYVYF